MTTSDVFGYALVVVGTMVAVAAGLFCLVTLSEVVIELLEGKTR